VMILSAASRLDDDDDENDAADANHGLTIDSTQDPGDGGRGGRHRREGGPAGDREQGAPDPVRGGAARADPGVLAQVRPKKEKKYLLYILLALYWD
jgi:hypothetical protein